MTGVLIRRKQRHIWRRWTCNDEGKDWRNASKRQRMPWIPEKHQKLEETRKDSLL